jgi:chemotaxis protein methyltransferase CheR
MNTREEGLTRRDYNRLCDLIYGEAGIALGSERKTMLEVRIKRRVKDLNFNSHGEYCEYLFTRQGLKCLR